MPKSPIRRCETCKGQGVVQKTTKTKVDGKTVTVAQSVKCKAGCNNGVIDVRSL